MRLGRRAGATSTRALWILILWFGYDRAPAGGPGGRGFHSSPADRPSLARGCSWRWSGGVRQGGDAFPGGHDGIGPGPGGGDLQPAAPGSAGQAGGGVEDPVAQGLRLGAGEVAVQGDQLEPGDQVGGDQGRGQPCAVDRQGLLREPADARVLAVPYVRPRPWHEPGGRRRYRPPGRQLSPPYPAGQEAGLPLSLTFLASVLSDLGRAEEAATATREAVEISRRLAWEHRPSCPNGRHDGTG
jgi:hypothetical protein